MLAEQILGDVKLSHDGDDSSARSFQRNRIGARDIADVSFPFPTPQPIGPNAALQQVFQGSAAMSQPLGGQQT